jgi:di/tripeptidase
MGVGYSKNHTNAEQITIDDLEKAGILVGDLILEMYARNAK